MHFTPFCETGCSCKVEVSFAAKCIDETVYELSVYVVSKGAHMEDV